MSKEECKSLADVCYPNRMRCLRNAARFQRTFGPPLKVFWIDNLLGMDVIKFGDFIKPNPEESIKEAIIRKYGEDGWMIVADLVGM